MPESTGANTANGDEIDRLPIFVPAKFRDEFLAKLKGAPLSVFLAYASRANKSGEAWPSIDRLCGDTGLSTHTVENARAFLISEGFLLPVADKQQREAQGKFGRRVFQVRRDF
ncbi:MAG TPA: helix-turn-helix domain-containing protein [Candidatus Acidoferrum sp.]|jgi:hypothetical protein